MILKKYKSLKLARSVFQKMPPQPQPSQSYEAIDQATSITLKNLGDIIILIKRVVRWIMSGKRTYKLASGAEIRDLRDFNLYIVVDDKENPILIAPLWTCNSNERCVVGSLGDLHCADFMYSTQDYELNAKAFSFLMDELRQEGVHTLHWNFLRDDSASSAIVSKYQMDVGSIWPNATIKLEEKSYEEHIKNLKKHPAQNLRTAYNRLRRDGKQIKIEICQAVKNPDMGVVALYAKRQCERYGMNSLKAKFHKLFLSSKFFYTNGGGGRFFVKLFVNEKLSAFMLCVPNEKYKSLHVPKLAIDSEYGFYSPGMILVSEFLKIMYNWRTYEKLDLGRGDEKYKLDLGATLIDSRHLTVTL